MTSESKKYHERLIKSIESRVSAREIVGYFSVDGDRKYLPNSSRLMYYKPPIAKNVYFDLNKGIETAVRSSFDQNGRISHLLEWIKLNHERIQSPDSKSWIKPKFVCSCKVLTTVMSSRFTSDNSWIICASKWKGSIYLCRFQTPSELKWSARIPQVFQSWGFKFEQYMLSDAPDKEPDTSKPVIEAAEFRCIIQRRIDNYPVLITAEVDGIISDTAFKDPLPLKDLRLVELKTSKIIGSDKQDYSFRKHKLLQWWCQSFIVGNEAVLCGFRDDKGIVRELRSYSLPEIIDMSGGFWDPIQCLNECRNFLNHVARAVVNDCDKTIYKFEKKSYVNNVVTTNLSPESEYNFMPLSYLTATG